MKKVEKIKRRMAKATKKLSPELRHLVTTKWTKKDQEAYRGRRLGKFGAASEVRRIDPKTLRA